VNRHSIAILLKSLLHLGYFPDGFQVVPESVKDFIAIQFGLLWDRSDDYRWWGGTRDYHLAQIRAFTGWRCATAADKDGLQEWLRREEAAVAISSEKLLDTACRRFRELRIEIPVEAELQRLVNAALNGYFPDLYESISSQMPADMRSRLDELLLVPAAESLSTFDLLKADAGAAGIESMRDEITKLRLLRSVGLPAVPFTSLPVKVLQLLKRRAWNEKASEMREHPDAIRYALLGCFLHLRRMEVLDDIARMAIEMIHRVDVRSDNQLNRELIENLKHVDGKLQILSRIAEAVVTNPDGIIREVLFPKVKEETFQDLVKEFRHSGPQKRFNSYNVTHPTYKALLEVGMAEKTIFLCDYLASRETQYEVNDGLQVVENWNATSDVICYGRRGELATNSREQQEITLLSLQLLQNCLMLVNTLLVERTLDKHGLWDRLNFEDLRALTPLFHTHINPYGVFHLDLESPSFLIAA
jgi:hypothetical protein